PINADWENPTEKAYKDSGLFSNIKIRAAETDLRAEIHVIQRGEDDLGLWAWTLTLFPGKLKLEYVIKTILKNKKGQELGAFEKNELVTMWFQFFLIFITPFNSLDAEIYDLLYDLNRATIIQAHSAGVLTPPDPLHRNHPSLYEWAHFIPRPD